jgi:hypothetical protein
MFSMARWLDPNSSYMRIIAIIQFILMWQVCITYRYLPILYLFCLTLDMLCVAALLVFNTGT